jgi:uncharacterized protein with HEPN domain
MSRDPIYMLDMLIAARKIQRFTKGIAVEEFEQDEKLQLALVRLIEIIGEAARIVSRQTKDTHPEISWQSIIGMRHRLIHEYFRVDLTTVWDVVQNDIPALITHIEPLIPPEEEA